MGYSFGLHSVVSTAANTSASTVCMKDGTKYFAKLGTVNEVRSNLRVEHALVGSVPANSFQDGSDLIRVPRLLRHEAMAPGSDAMVLVFEWLDHDEFTQVRDLVVMDRLHHLLHTKTGIPMTDMDTRGVNEWYRRRTDQDDGVEYVMFDFGNSPTE